MPLTGENHLSFGRWQQFNPSLNKLLKYRLSCHSTNTALIILIKNGSILSGCFGGFPALKMIIIFTLFAFNAFTSLRMKKWMFEENKI